MCIFYLDDGTLGGALSDVLHDIEVIKKEAGIVGLDLNPQKSDVISINPDLIATVESALSGIRVVNPADATLLGSPIGDIGSITVAIDAKTTMLKCLRERLHHLTSHDAYLLLRHSLAIPKLLYLLRTSPCFLSSSLKIYDDELRATVCSSFNIQLAESDPSWIQSTLPVCHGALRVSTIADTLFTDSSDPMHRARFLAASCKESGAWLNALPVTSLGLRMDDATMRISMGLRLGLPLCQSHTCQHCGAEVSQFATHAWLKLQKECRTPPPPFSYQ